ncbi:hypothetical protein MJG53_000308 [Ovis ammon polii x Ovis aries]|nr:hypothetical protein MJG53_000308 [Ovis ammon polii x Ovis aries]
MGTGLSCGHQSGSLRAPSKGERNSRVVPPFQESPRFVSPFQRNRFSLHCLDVQAEDRLPPRVHVGQPCGKASWESLVGKTRGKTIDALIHGADCVTLLLPLWRKAKGERNSRVVPPFQESPRFVSPFQRNRFSLHCLDVQAEDRLPPRVHVGQPCGKASWESLVGKTRGKTIDALIHGADCVTLLLPLWRKATGEESSGSGPEFTQGLRPRHQRERNSERPPRNSHGDWPFLRPPERVPEGPVGKNSRRSRRISRGGALHRKGERNSRVVPPFQESPRCVSPFQRNRFSLHCLDVQAEDRLPPRVHVGQPCGKASWESLVGKTRGKTIDALIHGADCVTLLLPLWRKAQVHARIRDED